MFHIAKTDDGKVAVKIDDQPATVVEPVELAGSVMAVCAHLGVDVQLLAQDLAAGAAELGKPISIPTGGAPVPGTWVAYESDGSLVVPFGSEIDALRHAVDRGIHAKFLPYGMSVRDKAA